MNKTFLHLEETGRYKKFLLALKNLLRWAVKSDGRSFLYTDFYNGWGCYCEVMLEICPTLQNFMESMVSVVKLDKIDIFSKMETSAILSMSGPINWSFSFAISIS